MGGKLPELWCEGLLLRPFSLSETSRVQDLAGEKGSGGNDFESCPFLSGRCRRRMDKRPRGGIKNGVH